MTPVLKDVLERAVSTWLEVFLGLLIAAPLVDTGLDVLQTAAVGGLPAALSVIKNALAHRRGR